MFQPPNQSILALAPTLVSTFTSSTQLRSLYAKIKEKQIKIFSIKGFNAKDTKHPPPLTQ